MTNEADRQTLEVEVEKHRNALSTIKEKIAAAKLKLSASDVRRGEFAHAAALGDDAAIKALAAIRRENQKCIDDAADLELALPDAQRLLNAAETKLRDFKRAAAKTKSIALARERIAEARNYDAGLAQAAKSHARLLELAAQLHITKGEEFSYMNQSLSIGAIEELTGSNRMLEATPSFMRRMFYSFPFAGKMTVKMEQAERAFWNMPPDEDDEKAA